MYRCLGLILLFALPAALIGYQRDAQGGAGEKVVPLELDHIYVWVKKGAPEAKALERLGLHTEGKVFQHTGQGTASIGFFFENAYLELISIEDEKVVAQIDKKEGTSDLPRSRWRETKASPFGIGLHRRPKATDPLPFPTRKSRADWMKPDTYIEMANSSLVEPTFFVVPEYMAVSSPDRLQARFQEKPELRKLFKHPLEVRKLTRVTVTVGGEEKLSPVTSWLSGHGLVSIERGKLPVVELVFDGGAKGKSADARPDLPIVIKY